MNYQVIVGNVGTVYSGPDRIKAEGTYAEYVQLSASREGGRVWGEPVEMHSDNEVVFSFPGDPEIS